MVPPEGRGVVGVKERVTGTEALPAMRSDEAMSNNTDETRYRGVVYKSTVLK